MRIKKFNESIDDSHIVGNKGLKIWSVNLHEYDDPISFTSEMLAADFFIKSVNLMIDDGDIHHSGKFEPFFDNSGNRFFTSIDENKDYGKCMDLYISTMDDRQDGVDTIINEGTLYSTVQNPDEDEEYEDEDDYRNDEDD